MFQATNIIQPSQSALSGQANSGVQVILGKEGKGRIEEQERIEEEWRVDWGGREEVRG